MPQMESAANLRRRYGDIEAIVSCGDLPAVYLEFITSILNVPLLYVRGNHDERYTEHPPGGDNLHRRLIRYKGVSFYGLEGSIRYNKSPIQYTERQMLRMVFMSFPRIGYHRVRRRKRVDVLVTHSPPRHIHDAEDIPHQGFQSLRWFMQMYRPRYMLHGHVHTWDRRKTVRTQFVDTCIINVNPITVLDIEPQ